jgi:hypothetical protein
MGMKKVKKITEREIVEIVNTLLEQENDEDIIYLSPAEALQYYDDLNYEDFTYLPEFRDKKIYITGNLDLRNKPVDSLGGIYYVDGNLDISYTKIKTLGNTKVKGYVSDWGSGVYNKRIAAERAQERAVADSRREEGEWDMEQYDDEETILANALWDYLVRTDEVSELDEDDKEQLSQLETELKELNQKYDSSDNNEEGDEIYDKITEIEEKIEEIKENKGDVYNLSPAGSYYGFKTFRIIGLDKDYDEEWSIATEYVADKALIEYWENYIDEMGADGFREDFIRYHIDGEKVREMAQDDYDSVVRDSPDSYFDEDDFDNSEIENQISNLEDEVYDLETELKLIEDSDSDEYEQLQELIDSKNEEIEKLEDSKMTEPTEEMIEQKVEELVKDAVYDPYDYLKNMGFDSKSIFDFVDTEDLAKQLATDEGMGSMNSYNSDYNVFEFNEKEYVVMQTNG